MSRKTSDVLWLALQYAKQDRITFIEACSHMPDDPAVKEARQIIREFNALQTRLFGTSRSQLDAHISKMKPITYTDLMRMIESGEVNCEKEIDPCSD